MLLNKNICLLNYLEKMCLTYYYKKTTYPFQCPTVQIHSVAGINKVLYNASSDIANTDETKC